MLSFSQRRKIALSSLRLRDFDVQMTQELLAAGSRREALDYIQRILDDKTRVDIFHVTVYILQRRFSQDINCLCGKILLGLSEQSTQLAYKTVVRYIDGLYSCEAKE